MAFLGKWVETSNNYMYLYISYVIEYVSYICFGRVETSNVYMCIYMLLIVLYMLLKLQLIVIYYMYIETQSNVCIHIKL